ncbi:MAG: 3-deoxy-8-phosphooctulonate synthase, partial [Deltaproteobacteria bacterium]|nr:3-deoxy-8-phosphooctulonate synthase [Deltaproteobacteria bacterium]
MRQFEIADGFTIGGRSPLFFIMGPCVIEDEATALNTLEALVRLTEGLKLRFVFKASYDKANRTSVKSFRGPGLKKGVKVLKKAKKEFPGVPLLTDVHCRHDVKEVAEAVDIIQIPAFLCRQTDLIVEAARAKRTVNIKKGQFMSPASIRNSIDKALSTGNDRIIVTERGVSFGYNNLVVDYRAIP